MGSADHECEWRPIPSFPSFEASADGRIRIGGDARAMVIIAKRWGTAIRKRAGIPTREIRQDENDDRGHRYAWVANYEIGYQKRKVSRLVCEAFRGTPSQGEECAHLDGDPSNNSALNLAWMTRRALCLLKRWRGTEPCPLVTTERRRSRRRLERRKLALSPEQRARNAENHRKWRARQGDAWREWNRLDNLKRWHSRTEAQRLKERERERGRPRRDRAEYYRRRRMSRQTEKMRVAGVLGNGEP